MSGWIQTTKTKFIHKEDKCPSNKSSYVCSSYNTTTQAISHCTGHRNVNNNRSLTFQEYGPGSIIHSNQPEKLRKQLIKELNERRKHKWYKNVLNNPTGNSPASNDIIKHQDENVLNSCIASLNQIINNYPDFNTKKDATVPQHAVDSGYMLLAENLKYLERNVLDSYKDCVCYSDCTQHGLSSWVERTWCAIFGGGGY